MGITGTDLRWSAGHGRRAAAVVAALLVGVLLTSCAAAQPARTPTPRAAPVADSLPVRLTPAPNVPGNPQNGRQLFASKGCTGCHSINGITTTAAIAGPNLTNMVLRPTLAGETIQNDPPTLAKWIVDPPAMKPGTAMPKLGVTEQEAQDLAAFLYSLPHNPGR